MDSDQHRLALDVHGGTYEFGEINADNVIVPFYTWFSNIVEAKYIDKLDCLPERTLIYFGNEAEYEKICNLACNLSDLDSQLEYMYNNVSYDDTCLVTLEDDFTRCKKRFFEFLFGILQGQNSYVTCVKG